jgi:sporulation protein YlmC with PRC-barrel domain
MPRHEWHDSDHMTRERDYGDRRERSRDYDYEGRDRGAFFSGDRDEPRSRRRMGGWGGLLGDESSGGRARSDYRREVSYGRDDYRDDIPTDETERLIASNKVEGTPVYDRNGDRLGSVHNFMVDKRRGEVRYAVLKHSSGFLGLDERYYPIDWDQLTYDPRLGGYHIDMTEDQLKRSGSWDKGERWQKRPGRYDRGREFEGRRQDRDREFERGSREPW